MVKQAFRLAEELGVEFDLQQPRSVMTELRKCQVERLVDELRNQRRQEV